MSQETEIVLTPHGRDKLEQRLEYLRNVQRREVAERIRDSRQFGDLTENAEYEDAKTEQALVEGQISELRRVLQIAQCLHPLVRVDAREADVTRSVLAAECCNVLVRDLEAERRLEVARLDDDRARIDHRRRHDRRCRDGPGYREIAAGFIG